MPITTSRDQSGQICIFTAVGRAPAVEIEEAFRSALENKPPRKFIWDFRNVDTTNMVMSAKEMEGFGRLSREYGMKRRTAIIASSDVVYGLSRMVEAYVGIKGEVDIGIFRTMEEALQWLG